jgi:hypothetical protein
MSHEMHQTGMGGQYAGTGSQMGSQQFTGGQQGFQQPGTQQPTGGQGQRLQEGLPPQLLSALEAFAEAEDVCEWCAEQCIQSGNPNMMRCIQLCRDVSDIAGVNHKFVARNSQFRGDVAQAFVRAARECAQECAQHSDAHCQDCAQVLNRVTQEIESTILGAGGQQPSGQMGGQGMTPQQMGGFGGQQTTQY